MKLQCEDYLGELRRNESFGCMLELMLGSLACKSLILSFLLVEMLLLLSRSMTCACKYKNC